MKNRRFSICAILLLPLFAISDDVNVKDYGAVGDGTAFDMPAIQRAIDACAKGGGGHVVFPAGRYLTGSLQLASGITLTVTPEATIVGSKSMRDYPFGALIKAVGATNVCVEGGGTVDGQGESFWEKSGEYKGTPWGGTAQFEYRALKRPSFLYFRSCTNLVLRDIRLMNSPSWTVHLHRCVAPRVERVTIRNPLYGPNTDGIDINSCIGVRVRNCDIVTGDDGVVLKSNEPGHDHPSRDIRVEDCKIWSACNALKIGTETHDSFEDIRFTGCTLYSDSDRSLDRPISGVAIESVDGSRLSNIVVSNITMRNVRAPLFIRLGHRGGTGEHTRQVEPRVPGTIENVVIRNVTAEKALLESSITGIPGYPVKDISLADIMLTYEGGGKADWVVDDVPDKAVIARYPEALMFGRLPAYGFFVRHVEGLRLSNVVVRCQQEDARPALACNDVKNLLLDKLSVAAAPADFPVLWFVNTSGATIRHCVAPSGTKTFLAAESEADADVVMEANDLTKAATPFVRLKPMEMLTARLPEIGEQSPGMIRIAADKMHVGDPMVAVADKAVPAGRAIEVPLGGRRDSGTARCRFTLAEAGDYVIWVRALAPSGDSNSFYAAIDGDEPVVSDLMKLGEWNWDRVRDRTNDKLVLKSFKTYHLSAGEHVLALRNRESGTRIGELVIVKQDRIFDPSQDLKNR